MSNKLRAPLTVTLFGHGVFADILKLNVTLDEGGPKPNRLVFL